VHKSQRQERNVFSAFGVDPHVSALSNSDPRRNSGEQNVDEQLVRLPIHLTPDAVNCSLQ
jgi:hypothetical protein